MFGDLFHAHASLLRLTIMLSIALIIAGCCAFQGRSQRKSRYLVAIVLVPLGALIFLVAAPGFPKYAFSKLVDMFTPFWIALTVLGLLRIARAVFDRRNAAKWLATILVCLLAAGAGFGSAPQWREVIDDRGILSVINSNEARKAYAAADTIKQGACLVVESHGILCAWLVYHARHIRTYVDADIISDHPVPPDLYPFRMLPALTQEITLLDSGGPQTFGGDSGRDLKVIVHNPQGNDGQPGTFTYWVGSEAIFEVISFSTSPFVEPCEIDFTARAGPANPDPVRKLTFSGEGMVPQERTFTSQSIIRFSVLPKTGKNVYILRVTYPTEQTYKVPGDPRNHMVWLEGVTIRKAEEK
jgi:uncharacterized membrane protein YhaH (DUF805 family)